MRGYSDYELACKRILQVLCPLCHGPDTKRAQKHRRFVLWQARNHVGNGNNWDLDEEFAA